MLSDRNGKILLPHYLYFLSYNNNTCNKGILLSDLTADSLTRKADKTFIVFKAGGGRGGGD